MNIFLTLCAFCVISIVFIGIYRIFALKISLFDIPNERSSHLKPVPLGSGIVFITLWGIYSLANYYQALIPIQDIYIFVVPTILISIVGYIDDKFKLAAYIRFPLYAMLACYGIFALGGYPSILLGIETWELGIVGAALAIIFTLWSSNLYNFMDGIDGLAAIEAISIYATGGYLFWLYGGFALALLCWGMVATVLGYLKWNWPSARIFMGDAGSVALGFLIVPVAIAGEIRYQVPALLWVILYALFLVDSGYTLIRRMWNKEKWYQAHRSHAYQRIYQAGWSKRQILYSALCINSILILMALIANYFRHYLLVFVVISLLLCTFIYYLVERKHPMYRSNSTSDLLTN